MIDIRELAAGPVLDRIVAGEVMGWDVHFRPAPELMYRDQEHFYDAQHDQIWVPHLWTPSTSPGQAQDVIGHLLSEHWDCEVTIKVGRGSPEDDKDYDVEIRQGTDGGRASVEYSMEVAICKAAIWFVRAKSR